MISVCIPTYNSEKYISDAIKSVQSQDGYSEIIGEVLISDNCSQDNTVSIVKDFMSSDDKIRMFTQGSNIGPHGNFNFLTKNCKFDIVKYLCSDDVLLPSVISRQYRLIRKGSVNDIITSDILVTDEYLNIVEYCGFGCGNGRFLMDASVILKRNFIGGPSNFMFDRRSLLDCGFVWDKRYKFVSDLKFCMTVLGGTGQVININEPGYYYRRHRDSDTEKNCKNHVENLREWNEINLLLKAKSTPGFNSSIFKCYWMKAVIKSREINCNRIIKSRRWDINSKFK